MSKFDVIVVGARCAGASTAMLLARKGHKVLLIDRDAFPSDMPASTHMIWYAGAASLKRWGLLDRLRATGCAPMKLINLDLGELVLSGPAPPAGDVTECFAPRRLVLDALLVDAAVAAGAELRRGSVLAPLSDGDRVTGLRYSDRAGAQVEVKADLVVGADGTGSTLARALNVPAYNEYPQLQGTVWGYFADLPLDSMEFYSRPGRMIYSWSTNDGLTLAGICIRYEDYRVLSGDPERGFYAELDRLVPQFGERARAAKREGPIHMGATRGLCRKAAGPGWALVGDAGITMDPITAAGISNAFRDAEFLAEAVHEGLSKTSLDAALAPFEERRNQHSVPLHEFTRDMAKLEPPPQEIIDLLVALRDSPQDTSEYFGVFAQTVPVQQFFAPDNMSRIIQRRAATA